MEDQHRTDREKIQEFVDWLHNPWSSIVPHWEELTARQQQLIREYVGKDAILAELAYSWGIKYQTIKNHSWQMRQITGYTLTELRHLVSEEIRKRAYEVVQSS
jgi:predicted DNA-binding protein YlxM (UPF0122 family)